MNPGICLGGGTCVNTEGSFTCRLIPLAYNMKRCMCLWYCITNKLQLYMCTVVLLAYNWRREEQSALTDAKNIVTCISSTVFASDLWKGTF